MNTKLIFAFFAVILASLMALASAGDETSDSSSLRVKRGHGGGGGGGGYGHGPGRGGGASGPVYICGYVGGKEGYRSSGYGR